MSEWRDRLARARPSNWASWPTLRRLWPWFAALGAIVLMAIPWGIRAEERSLEASSRQTLAEAGILVEDITFNGRQATIVADLSTNDQIAAVSALAKMGGVAQVSWEEGSGLFAQVTPTLAPTTSTVAPEPGAELTASVKEGRITLRGIVPAARIIKDVNDAAVDLWGSDVVNQLFVDDTVVAYPWLGEADSAVAGLTMLIDPQLTLDAEGATITGGATDQANLDAAIGRLAATLGPQVAINNKVTVTPLDLPNFEIISPGDGTVTLQGTVANLDVRRAIVLEVLKTGEDLEITNQIRLSDRTADVYLLRRIPEVVASLGAADQWTLRFDGASLEGSAVGGSAFNGNRIKPTAQLADLAGLLGAFLQADPRLVAEIEVHADPRDGGVDPVTLASQRAEAIAAHLVRLGVEPDRVSASNGAGDGEILRFQLVPADQ